jgi:hypothetical protein
MCETANGCCASIHRAESLTFSLWRITGGGEWLAGERHDQAPPEWRSLV